MQLGLVGLGRMGGPMAARLVKAGHDVVGTDTAPDAAAASRQAGVRVAGSIAALVDLLTPPRAVWVMVQAGAATEAVLDELAELLEPGDLVADGGNSDWRDATTRADRFGARGVQFVDVGVSGGRQGWRHGYGLTAGGAPDDVERLMPVLTSLAAPGAVARVGEHGAGHFVKAVHNAVEYGLLQAYAEGFAMLSARDGLDALTAMRVWQAGCSARSFLLEQTVEALSGDPALTGVGTAVADSGMGRWTAEEAIRLGVATPVLTAALHARFTSRDEQRRADRLLVAARGTIGGHETHV
ncbi:NADP-dependent phosphogluconate dehydrogenase [Allokutzneria albata]|uniref:6-phosphogluconate dehydrogenase (Decarboxylating) n=1 Tax=Allokutzneria albata TaxID=211114 RepID=A0A1G9SWQ2_ALLAB|nr:NADP-dependent phosphogluconate dehydrogenase [Allokutzneria albata]SDM39850.1 6-phosphogluconate dehydrogenase (decarboxylating) [Allokutzneria albata]